MTGILFVCHGNICRSPMAEFVMRDMVRRAGLAREIAVASAATSAEEIAAMAERLMLYGASALEKAKT